MTYYPDPYMMEELLVALIPLATSGVPSLLLGIASYVLTSLALYTLASRRGIGNAWLSWVPVLNVWIIGSLSDQYRYVVKGQYKSKRKILLILQLIKVLLGICLAIFGAAVIVDIISDMMQGTSYSIIWHLVTRPLMAVMGLCIPMSGLSIAVLVIRYMAMYDIYTSMDTSNNVMFLVLSILFPITEPFFLFFNREKDGGMPPRRQAPVYETTENNKEYL